MISADAIRGYIDFIVLSLLKRQPVTETGPAFQGTIKSSVAFGTLLS